MREILELLEQDATLRPEEIATRLGRSVEEVSGAIEAARRNGQLLGFSAVVNWEKVECAKIYAFIAVSATPEHGRGFDAIAEHIALFDEVHSVYLMSGGFDLQVVVEGEDFRQVAQFVAEKLAPIPGVRSTATSFVLKTYKMEGRSAQELRKTDRLAVTP